MNDLFDLTRFATAAARDRAREREKDALLWLRENWPWHVRWAIGYPRVIRVLDRLGLVTLPVFVNDELKSREEAAHE